MRVGAVTGGTREESSTIGPQDAANASLASPEAARRVVRGGAVRALGNILGMLLTAVAAVFVMRHLGVVGFGEFVTVTALVGIVGGLAEAGLTAISQREYVLLHEERDRRLLLGNVLWLRLVISSVGVAVGALIAWLALGYDDAMVWGVILAGAGLVIFMGQATLSVPLAVDLRIPAITAAELARQGVLVVGYGILVIAGASLIPFLAVQVPAAIVSLVITVALVGVSAAQRPVFDPSVMRNLVRNALPIALAAAVVHIYFRALMIMMSLMASDVQVGLFATSFRVVELVVGIPGIVLATVMPVLSHAARDDSARLRYVMQRTAEVAVLGAVYVVILVGILAGPVIELLGGAAFLPAAPILRVQAVAFLGVFLVQAWSMGLVAVHRQSALIVTNLIGLATVLVAGPLLIAHFAAMGAAAAAAVADLVLAAVTLIALTRSGRGLAPSMGFGLKVAVAAAVTIGVVVVVPTSEWVLAAIASIVFAAAVLVTRACPPEILHLLPRFRAR